MTYTNRKGVTYYLRRTITKTGKPRYVFAREPKGELVEQIPEGWRISESVNGIVSLVKDRPAQILPQEVAAVEAAVAHHPKSRNYRVAVKHNRIEVYERVGPDADELLAGLAEMGFGMSRMSRRFDRLRADMDRRAQFTPVLRFILADAEQRTFRTERWCYRGSIDDWLDVHQEG
ncbi:MAG: hypothetical protein SWK90_20615, partial [Chloroflexota bacterium]|nr:hypothetical protein [Chloroflexota bacterium]